MAKFEEANVRWFKNIFICRKCNAKIRAPNIKILAGKVKCRKCKKRALRPKRKK